MENKSILFVGQIGTFLINTMTASLAKEGFMVYTASFQVSEINEHFKEATALFLSIEDNFSTDVMAALNFVKDQCIMDDKKVFAMGEDEQVAHLKKIIGEDLIWESFLRPINPRQVCETIGKLFDSASNVSQKKRILVVDDSGTFLHNIKSWLEPTYKVAMVNSVTNGLSYLGKQTPDLILLDYEMPVCNGPQMLEMLRADPEMNSIPVFFLTGKGDRASIEKVLALKPQGYLLKTLPKEKILEALQQFFNSQEEKKEA